MQINLSDVYITLVNSNRNFSITKLLTLGVVVMDINSFNHEINEFKQQLLKERKNFYRKFNDFDKKFEAFNHEFESLKETKKKKLNIDVQLHITIEEE